MRRAPYPRGFDPSALNTSGLGTDATMRCSTVSFSITKDKNDMVKQKPLIDIPFKDR
jgi:hypothetical protein